MVDFFGPEGGPIARPISFKVISLGGKMSFKVMSSASFKNNKNTAATMIIKTRSHLFHGSILFIRIKENIRNEIIIVLNQSNLKIIKSDFPLCDANLRIICEACSVV
jgi:hypothetical protein